jgi:hypothetical protein
MPLSASRERLEEDDRPMTRSSKVKVAFFIGVIALFTVVGIWEAAGPRQDTGATIGFWVATLVLLGALFFVAQFLLSRGADEWKREWPIMLALNGITLGSLVIGLVVCLARWSLPDASVLPLSLLTIIACEVCGTVAGAWVAARSARRDKARKGSKVLYPRRPHD